MPDITPVRRVKGSGQFLESSGMGLSGNLGSSTRHAWLATSSLLSLHRMDVTINELHSSISNILEDNFVMPCDVFRYLKWPANILHSERRGSQVKTSWLSKVIAFQTLPQDRFMTCNAIC